MALPTTEHPAPHTPQHPTPGVVRQGAAPVVTEGEPAVPILMDDIDPVLLVRLYPDEVNLAGAKAQAMAAGMAAREQGMALVASQQEPVLFEGQPIPPPASRAPAAAQHPAAPHQPPH